MPALVARERDDVQFTAQTKLPAGSIGFALGLILRATSAGPPPLIGLALLLVFPLSAHKLAGPVIPHAVGMLWVALLAHLVAGNVDTHVLAWLLVGSILFWDRVYGHVFPAALRWWLAPGQAALTVAIAGAAIAIAARLPGWPVVSYCLLGGVWGVLGHAWGIYLGLMDKPPLLHGASPVAAVILAFFEFTFYFCVVVAAASLVHRLRRPSVAA